MEMRDTIDISHEFGDLIEKLYMAGTNLRLTFFLNLVSWISWTFQLR